MSSAINPYIAGNPVGGSTAFVGRDDVLRAVLGVLRDPQHQGMVLYGQRRIGKTSILKHLAAWLPKNGGPRAIYFDLQDKASQPVGKILIDLAGAIADALDLPDPKPAEDVEAWFRDTWLPQVLPAGDSLAVLLDEFDVLADAESQKAASATLFGYLRELLRKVPRLKLVFVIGRNLEDLSYLAGPLFKALPSAHISLLQRTDADAVPRLSEKNESLAWQKEALEKVWMLTHGHPYLLQHLCWQIWQRKHEREGIRLPVTPANVEAAVPGTLDSSRNALEWLWGGLPPAARVVASALAKAGKGAISQETLERALEESGVRVLIGELQAAPQQLAKWDIIEPAPGGYCFRVELLRQWIAEHKPLALVQQELDHIEPLAEALYKTGEAFFKTGDLDAALEQLQKATRINPNHRRANMLVAGIHISKSAWAEARAVLAKLGENYPADAKPRLVQVLLAQAEAADADEDERLDLFQHVLKLDARNATAVEGRHRIQKARGDRALAAEDFVAARAWYEAAGLDDLAREMRSRIDGRALVRIEARVRVLEEREEYERALEEIRLSREQLADLKDWGPDIARLERAQETQANYQRAVGALKGGEADTAISLLAPVVGSDPRYKDAARLLYEAVSNLTANPSRTDGAPATQAPNAAESEAKALPSFLLGAAVIAVSVLIGFFGGWLAFRSPTDARIPPPMVMADTAVRPEPTAHLQMPPSANQTSEPPKDSGPTEQSEPPSERGNSRDASTTPTVSSRPSARPQPTVSAQPSEPTSNAPLAAAPAPELAQEAIMRRQLEPKVWAGRASIEEIRLLRAICSHMGDEECRRRASAELTRKQGGP